MTAIEERISDRHVLKLLRAMLRAGVMMDGAVTRSNTGAPQGGVLSPCLANVYLHRLDRQWADRGTGVLVRYADDLLAMCRTRQEAERALSTLTAVLAELGLELKPAKTRIVHLTEGGEGLDFLGFHHRWVRGNTPRSRHLCFLARWPSRLASQRARYRIREITDRSRLLVPVEQIVQDLNWFLRGWSGYFRYGNSAREFNKINHYAVDRLARFIGKRHKRGWGYGMKVVGYQSHNRLGLITLNGTIVAPRPNRPWRPRR
jgi:RNA-directed DNA polymerase